MMGCLLWALPPSPLISPWTQSTHKPPRHQQNNIVAANRSSRSPPQQKNQISRKSVVSAAIAVLLFTPPVNAGLLSGFGGMESIHGPDLPQIDFLNRLNEENQKRYADDDARFKESPLLKQLLEKSKLNKEKNRRAIQDKYCIRGAEWGIGDCSTAGMSQEDRENFISALKQKAGVVD
ncbi:unnamed protein product [Cuscuta campestris]|uniref:Uncharacterized protein n=2 Tax=Cuscuta sect. Cleistogrammica TaxID=1824901 RepID=A0A484L3X6_9ASTE|nr:hypothetical protein DM860_000304 [Cuscuta australis]VFQ71026.1 unnamed protein product [Cuscuta campestris]VFQ71033.1 unnamed protein product [Cuscuta campestris]